MKNRKSEKWKGEEEVKKRKKEEVGGDGKRDNGQKKGAWRSDKWMRWDEMTEKGGEKKIGTVEKNKNGDKEENRREE